MNFNKVIFKIIKFIDKSVFEIGFIDVDERYKENGVKRGGGVYTVISVIWRRRKLDIEKAKERREGRGNFRVDVLI